MAAERLTYLFDLFLKGQCTDEEKKELAARVLSAENEAQVNDLLRGAWDQVVPNEMMPEEKASQIINSILQEETNKQEKHGIQKRAKVVSVISWRSISVAASVFLIFSVAAYFLLFNKGEATNETVNTGNVTNDIAPGGNKAILTLADGSSIVLDSARNGMLSQQGSSKVIKLDDGKIAYDQSGSQQSAIQYNTISTPRGGQYQLTLADGSQVWLNAASGITFPTAFSGDKREVKITGEAYFEVAHNANMPFRVRVGDMEVQVLGTHFNVNAYKDDDVVKTTLMEGSIKLVSGTNEKLLKPGQQAEVNSHSEIKIDPDADIEMVMAWKNGRFEFKNADLKSILKQVERWYDVKIVYEDDIKDRFGGEISRNANLSQVLNILEATKKIKLNINGNTVTVKSITK